jgi:hypothetical protein
VIKEPPTFRTGRYIVTLFGDADSSVGRPAIASTSGVALDGEPLALPSGDGKEGGTFTFEFVVGK